MKKNNLFSEFDAVSAKAFKQKIQFDLKGADYNELLLWSSPEGIAVKPFYHSDDITEPLKISTPDSWAIGEALFIDDIQKTATLIHKAIKGGAEELWLSANATFDIIALLKSIESKEIPIHFIFNFLDSAFYNMVKKVAQDIGVQAIIHSDIIHNFASTGNWYQSLDQDHQLLKELVSEELMNFGVNLELYANAGANRIQQLAYGLAQANEYLNFCTQNNLPIAPFVFKIGVSSNYFFEIAKVRAFRLLIESLIAEYKLEIPYKILATPYLRDKTLYDYNTNMLRTTTACMSAILGGADSVINQPYDAIYHKLNDFGQRIARNQLLILKRESYFDVVSNPSDGSYYIDSITQQLADKALNLFKDIEKSGGFIKQLKEGIIQRKIKESARKEQEQFNEGKRILLGTNKHPNSDDRMKENLELYPFVKVKTRKTVIEPIIPKRLAQEVEQERLKQEE